MFWLPSLVRPRARPSAPRRDPTISESKPAAFAQARAEARITAMACPTGCSCLASSYQFTAMNDNVANSHVLYATAAQRLTVTEAGFPAEGTALQAAINGPPQSLYIKLLPLSLGACCYGAISDPTHSTPAYGGPATAGSSGPAGVTVTLPTNTYKICVAANRATPPFSDTDYLMSANAILTVHPFQPPPPPSPPPPVPPPISPPPISPPISPPYSPPMPPFPLFGALTPGGLEECAFAPPPGSALPPPPGLPPQPNTPPQQPPAPLPPGPIYPPSPFAPPPVPPSCITLGTVVVISVLLFAICLVAFFCVMFKKSLDAVNCGPSALADSFAAIRSVPTNAEVGTPKGLEKIKVAILGDGFKLSLYVQLVCSCICLALFGTVAVLVVSATSSALASNNSTKAY